MFINESWKSEILNWNFPFENSIRQKDFQSTMDGTELIVKTETKYI